MKKVFKIIVAVLLLAIVVDIAASFYFYRVAIARTSKEFLNNNKDLEATPVISSNDAKYEWFNSKKFKDVEIKSEDGLKLHGYYLEAQVPTKKTAILAHGYASKGKDMISYARF